MAYKLNVELVPDGCWYSNLRSILSKKQWDFLRDYAKEKSGGKCSICGKKVKGLHAHERWSYDEKNAVQKLEDIIAVCPDCHSVIHIGRTQLLGFEDDAIKHFKKVNKCDFQGYVLALQEATQKSVELSTIDAWALDLTWLERFLTNKE